MPARRRTAGLAVRCEFCSYRARFDFEGVSFCLWHITLLYLGLRQDWHD